MFSQRSSRVFTLAVAGCGAIFLRTSPLLAEETNCTTKYDKFCSSITYCGREFISATIKSCLEKPCPVCDKNGNIVRYVNKTWQVPLCFSCISESDVQSKLDRQIANDLAKELNDLSPASGSQDGKESASISGAQYAQQHVDSIIKKQFCDYADRTENAIDVINWASIIPGGRFFFGSPKKEKVLEAIIEHSDDVGAVGLDEKPKRDLEKIRDFAECD
tara:strand:- start:3898 stop:4551 length:654 start_codon:yes stop_codon:yes gene_type:complete